MSKEQIYHGSCFCGAVQFTLKHDPEAMAYCHCDSCRHWSAAPLSAFTLWKPGNLKINKGENNIAAFNKNPKSDNQDIISIRKWCSTCGGHIYTEHPTMGLIDVPVAVIKDFIFTPSFHVHYQESVQPVKDGLPKFKDLPSEAGGTGTTLVE